MTKQYAPEAQETCPCCNQPVLTIPLEYQCNYPGCEKLGEWEAWFGDGLIWKMVVCEEHLKLSIRYKALVKELSISDHQIIMREVSKEAALIRDDGRPADEETLLAGLSFEINRRVEEGIFV